MADGFEALATSVASELQHLTTPGQLEEPGRASLLAKVNQLRTSLMSPPEILFDLTQSSNRFAAARIAIATGIFDAFAAAGSVPTTVELILPKVKGDQQLVARLVSLLAVKGFLIQTEPGKYKSTPLGMMMANNSPPAMFVIHFYDALKVHGELFDYFVKNDFKNPSDYYSSPWAKSHSHPKGFFDWVSQEGLRQQAFNVVMTVNQSFRGQDWFEFFPVAEKFQGTSSEDIIFVDIGGGVGHDAIGFREKYPDIPGKVVLQDLPSVVKEVTAPLPANFEVQAYDFFTPQLVKGAKVYYLRTVLHDWPDKQALEILRIIKAAMIKEKSVLLVNENLMDAEKPSEIATDVDFIMMTNMASLERTERQWLQLLQAADFDVVNTWRPTAQQVSPNALFEAVPR